MKDLNAPGSKTRYGLTLLAALAMVAGQSMDAANSANSVSLTQVTLNPPSISFGSVPVGQSDTQPATVTNSSGSSVTMPQATVTGTGFSLSGLSLPLTLADGQSVTFNVNFAPSSSGVVSGTVSLVIDGRHRWNTTTLTAPLSGTGTTSGPSVLPLQISTLTLPGATVGTAYSATLRASGGTAPYTWTLASGTLPAGLMLSTSGVISGTPSATATSYFFLQAKDSATSPQAATSSFSIITAAATGGLATDCTLYASATGNDNNSGTSPSSPKTLAGASSKTVPGSVVCLLGGTYNLSSTFYPFHAGSSSAWITYKNYGDSAAVLVWHGGSSQSDTSMVNFYNGSGFSSGSNYVEVRGLKFDGQNQSSVALTCHWAHHLRFMNNTIKNMGAAGISTRFCDYITADHNTVFHSGYLQGWSSGISYNSTQWLDTYVGFHNYVTNNIISGQYDATAHSDGNGIIMDLSNGSYTYSTANTPPALVANNVVYENGGRCIHPYIVTNIWVVNNTCYKNALDTTASFGEEVNSNSNNIHLINNLVYSWNNHQSYQQQNNGAGLVYYKDLYFGGANNFTYSDPTQFINADPLFVNPPVLNPTASGQYANAVDPSLIGNALTLQATSPAIDRGIDPSLLPGLSTAIITGLRQYLYTDINGRSRPQGSAFDLGAYEH